MSESELQKIKAVLRSLVLSQKGGLTIKQLNNDYREIESTPIPYAKFGYSSMQYFLMSMNSFIVSILDLSIRVILRKIICIILSADSRFL